MAVVPPVLIDVHLHGLSLTIDEVPGGGHINGIQWDGTLARLVTITNWIHGTPGEPRFTHPKIAGRDPDSFGMPTASGTVENFLPGDWILRDDQGRFHRLPATEEI